MGAPSGRADRIDVFKGDRIGILELIASNLWGTTFFAEDGQQYRIRLSNLTVGFPLNFRWTTGASPVDDDFAEAGLLEGASGTAEGTSGGATLQPGEWFGDAAATTWYQWSRRAMATGRSQAIARRLSSCWKVTRFRHSDWFLNTRAVRPRSPHAAETHIASPSLNPTHTRPAVPIRCDGPRATPAGT